MSDSCAEREPRSSGRPRCGATDEAVLMATLRQLATAGYSRMSVEAIAEEAGTTKPTIYRRWPSKAELVVAALARFQTTDVPRPTGSLRDDLVALLGDFQAKLLRPNGMAMIGTILVEERYTPELIRTFRKNIVRPRRAGILSILEAARDRGELREDADLDAAVNMLVGAFYARYLTGDGIPEDWGSRIVDELLVGMAPRVR
jgi:AcrR family transcriptional regulator